MSLKDSIKKFLFKPEEPSSPLSLSDRVGNGPARRPVRYVASRPDSRPFVRPWETAANDARRYEGGQSWTAVKGKKP